MIDPHDPCPPARLPPERLAVLGLLTPLLLGVWCAALCSFSPWTPASLAEILARGKAEKGFGIPPESRPAPRISGRVYTHLPPRILVRAYASGCHPPGPC
jgi:hypothetical protein